MIRRTSTTIDSPVDVVCIFRIGPAASLTRRGRVELDGMLQDTTFHLVFTLIFDVGLGLGGKNDVIRRVMLLCALKHFCSKLRLQWVHCIY